MELRGKKYTLIQCEGDIFDWYDETAVGVYTKYYDRVVFHTEEGMYVAYHDDLENGTYM